MALTKNILNVIKLSDFGFGLIFQQLYYHGLKYDLDYLPV